MDVIHIIRPGDVKQYRYLTRRADAFKYLADAYGIADTLHDYSTHTRERIRDRAFSIMLKPVLTDEKTYDERYEVGADALGEIGDEQLQDFVADQLVKLVGAEMMTAEWDETCNCDTCKGRTRRDALRDEFRRRVVVRPVEALVTPPSPAETRCEVEFRDYHGELVYTTEVTAASGTACVYKAIERIDADENPKRPYQAVAYIGIIRKR